MFYKKIVISCIIIVTFYILHKLFQRRKVLLTLTDGMENKGNIDSELKSMITDIPSGVSSISLKNNTQ